MPNAIGTDFKAIERLVAARTGLPTLGFRTDGIHSYLPEPAVPMSGWPRPSSRRRKRHRSDRQSGSISWADAIGLFRRR